MEKHFLLIEDKSYRVEVNMRTAEAWERLSGMKIGQFEMQAAQSAKTGGVPTRTMLYWLYCSLMEGEDLEGREFPYQLEELRKVIRPSILTEYAPIFIACYIGESSVPAEKKTKQQKKRNRILSVLSFFFRSPWVYFTGPLLFFSTLALVIYLLR